MRSENQAYSGEVKQLDSELVDAIRIPIDASDADVQNNLDELYNKDETRDKLKKVSKQVLTMDEEDSFNVVLEIAETSIHIDS